MITVKSMILCFVVLSLSAIAADYRDSGNSKIDTWMEGTIEFIDSNENKFTVRGGERYYATQYTAMEKDVRFKTSNLAGADRDAKIAEVHASWNDTLKKASMQLRIADSDFNFRVGMKDGTIASFDESRKTFTTALSDFQVGEYVVVGYEFGANHNDAYYLAKENKPVFTSINAQYIETISNKPITLDPAIEQTDTKTVDRRR